ncbi:hypothetical protein [Amycolatopsis sp. NBC_01480]|uniref:hypothetical protein n=1 Tax=Amycolatopsis sp. NBC_01480 TaxID=2903562 RepID=UPI002E2BD84A|nr:hypothetical protein [Amycolatopsis sp. NBC_01480]
MSRDNIVESALRLRHRAFELRATGEPRAIAAAEVAERAADSVLARVEQAEDQPGGDRP